jgi:hypothetical protein
MTTMIPCAVCLDGVEKSRDARCFVCGTAPLCPRCIAVNHHDCEQGT